MKQILTIVSLVLSQFLNGQSITFSEEILNSKDPEIVSVSGLWKEYMENSSSDFSSSFLMYWNPLEPLLGFTDIVLAQSNGPSYLIGNIEVYDIKEVERGFYSIRNKWTFRNGQTDTPLADFSVIAKQTETGFKLYNYFFLAKSELNSYKVGNLEYYYPDDFPFNIQKANEMARFHSELSSKYGLSSSSKVIYIIGNSIAEANQFIGFEYTIMSSPLKCAAYTIRDMNIIIASVDNHKHEIVHSVLEPAFPDASRLFHEGIATYYGGSCEKDYMELVDQLKYMIQENPTINLSDIDELEAVLDDGTNYFYTIGAIFINYALHVGDVEKVLALMRWPKSNGYTSDDAIDAIANELGIERSEIDSIVKEFVRNKSFPDIKKANK